MHSSCVDSDGSVRFTKDSARKATRRLGSAHDIAKLAIRRPTLADAGSVDGSSIPYVAQNGQPTLHIERQTRSFKNGPPKGSCGRDAATSLFAFGAARHVSVA
jgi:hypothetical protein